MAYNEQLAEKVRQALSHLKNVQEKKMFRGITFMLHDKMCISVGDDEMMCRIDPALHDSVTRKKGCKTMKMRGREYKGWILVSEEGMETKKDFEYWIRLALDFNKKAKSSKKK
jgi:TfoX/Sxy family transcriptional regulator of competence genes